LSFHFLNAFSRSSLLILETHSHTIVRISSFLRNCKDYITATGGSCTFSLNLNNTNIQPTATSVTYTTGEALPSKTVTYLWDQTDQAIMLFSIFTDEQSGQCFEMFAKQ
jgi:hypothetical protein